MIIQGDFNVAEWHVKGSVVIHGALVVHARQCLFEGEDFTLASGGLLASVHDSDVQVSCSKASFFGQLRLVNASGKVDLEQALPNLTVNTAVLFNTPNSLRTSDLLRINWVLPDVDGSCKHAEHNDDICTEGKLVIEPPRSHCLKLRTGSISARSIDIHASSGDGPIGETDDEALLQASGDVDASALMEMSAIDHINIRCNRLIVGNRIRCDGALTVTAMTLDHTSSKVSDECGDISSEELESPNRAVAAAATTPPPRGGEAAGAGGRSPPHHTVANFCALLASPLAASL
jgi:hypothetical protein